MNADDGDTHICMHINIGAYALFLEEKCKDYGAAAEMYLRAVRAGSVFTTVFTTVFTILITTVLTTGFFFLLSTWELYGRFCLYYWICYTVFTTVFTTEFY